MSNKTKSFSTNFQYFLQHPSHLKKKKKKSKHCSTETLRGRVRYAVSEKMEEARGGEKRMSSWRERGL
jgi:hypothetical protein